MDAALADDVTGNDELGRVGGADLDAAGEGQRDVRCDESANLEAWLDEHVGVAVPAALRHVDALDAEAAAEAEVRRRGRRDVEEKPAADVDGRVVGALWIEVTEEPARVQLARIVVD